MTTLTKEELLSLYREAGVRRGDSVLLRADIRRLPIPKVTDLKSQLCPFYIDTLLELLGPEGNLFTNTANASWASEGKPFHVESSPSTTGVLTEYIRKLPGSVRSSHPGGALSGIGPCARPVCEHPHHAAFGYDSPWGLLWKQNVLLLGLGVESFSFNHLIESLAAVPYRYTKVFPYPVYRNGRRLGGCFTMFVRYLHLPIVMRGDKLTRILHHEGKAKRIPLANGVVATVRVSDYVQLGLHGLRENPHFLLAHDLKYEQGKPPLDTPHIFPESTS